MRQHKIRSKYNENERFDFLNVPDTFNSVTEASIKDTKTYCMKSVARKFDNFDAGVLSNMLDSTRDKFTNLYKQLEKDYEARKKKLAEAYKSGVSDIAAEIIDFRDIVADYRKAQKEYSDCLVEIMGKEPDDTTEIDEEKIKLLEEKVKKLDGDFKNGK